jgi:3'(2'), 5'-bisphosphate nucleotidase
MMNGTQPEGMLTAAAEIAREAGRIILRFFQKEFSHRLKADRSPVTEADMASHTFLVKALDELTPGLPVVSEEIVGIEKSIAPRTDYWLVDPLDGTKSFLKGLPEFTVNLALMRLGNPALGVVWAPALDLMYLGHSGQGAWRQQGTEPAARIRSRRADLNRMTVVASKDHSGPRVKRMLERLSSPEVTNIGSSLKFCLVAEGRADLYFRDLPTMEWDTAAAQCVVEAAGGRVLDLSGEGLRYGKPGLKNSGFVTLGDPSLRWRDLIGD